MPETAGLAGPRLETRWKSIAVRITGYDGGAGARLLAITKSNRQYLIPAGLVSLLEKLDGTRTLEEIAAEFIAPEGVRFSAEDLATLIEQDLQPKGLVENVGGAVQDRQPATRLRRADFIFRFRLLSAQQVAPATDRLKYLFNKRVAQLTMVLIALAHVLVYSQAPARVRATGVGDLLLTYGIVLATVLFHELGHASACRRFACEHNEIGACLYLVFPALYCDLSPAWRLERRQRAVIDVGGIYFQQILFVPLSVWAVFGGSHVVTNVVYSIDAMSLISLNPFLKCDGYWLIADISGIANLHARALKLIGSVAAGLARRARRFDAFRDLKLSQRLALSAYSFCFFGGMLVGFPYLFWRLPQGLMRVVAASRTVLDSVSRGDDESIIFLHVRTLLVSALVIPIMIRMGQLIRSGVLAAWRKYAA